MRVHDIPEVARLSTPERILLVEDLWDSITVDASQVPVPESHKAELDRRFRLYECGQSKLLNLEDLKARITSRK